MSIQRYDMAAWGDCIIRVEEGEYVLFTDHEKAVKEAGRKYLEWVRQQNAAGLCEDSGLPFKQCILGVCDCGLEFTPDEDIDGVVASLIEKAREKA